MERFVRAPGPHGGAPALDGGPPEWRGPTLPGTLLFNLTGGLASFGIIFYARDVFHASAVQIGWLVAMPQLAYLASCLFFPPLFGLLLARHYLIVATDGTALLLAGLLAGRSLPSVFVLFGLSDFLIALFWPPLMGWLARGLDEDALGRTLRNYNLTWSSSHIVSPYAAGLLLEREPTGRQHLQPPDRSTPLRFAGWVGQVAGYLLMGMLASISPCF